MLISIRRIIQAIKGKETLINIMGYNEELKPESRVISRIKNG